MSPDWADKPELVPYANLPEPQSLNLYVYAGNNLLSRRDGWAASCVRLPTHFGWSVCPARVGVHCESGHCVVIARCNQRETAFLEDGDHEIYRDLLALRALKADVAGWAYCLLPNFIYMI